MTRDQYPARPPDPVVEPAPQTSYYPGASVLGELLPHWVASAPEEAALTCVEGERWTWRELGEKTARAQALLEDLGCGPGDEVALLCDNGAPMVASFLAIVGCGAVAVPINTGLVGEGLAAVIEHCGARILFIDPDRIEGCRRAGVMLDDLHLVPTDSTGWEAALPPSRPLTSRGAPEAPAMILYSSGTTGRSKGVVLSHATCLIGARACAQIELEATRDDVLFTSLPLFHCAAQQMMLWGSLVSGAQLVLSDKFSVSQFWSTVREHGVTAFHFIGPMMSLLWEQPPSEEDRDHPARLAVGGGPRSVWTEFEDRFDVQIVESYGMTEAFGGCVTHRPGRGKPWTTGRPAAHVQVEVVVDGNRIAAPLEQGEIRIRPRVPHAMFSGYHRDPARSADAWDEGWYCTGDIGSFDEDGFLRWHGRQKDLVRVRGENVSTLEVEAVIASHRAVAEAAVVGVPSRLGEDDIFAVVVPRSGQVIDPEDLWAYCDVRLARFAVPRYVAAVDALPKTATHRVQKHRLEELLPDAADRGERTRREVP